VNGRLEHLREVSALLWPAPASTRIDRPRALDGEQRVGEYLLLPTSGRPKLLAPAGRRAAAAVVRYHGEGRTRAVRLQAAVLASGLRLGLGAVLWRRRYVVHRPAAAAVVGLDAHLAQVLGQPVDIGMHLGAPRANRKPVLQVVTPGGVTLAYAKLGVDPLTDALVGREADALRELAADTGDGLQVPGLLHAGTWAGHTLLVQSALPVWERRARMTDDRLVAAVGRIAAIGRTEGRPLLTTPWWAQLQAALAAVPPEDAATELRALVARLGFAAADVALPLGASHGDWTPWNMACLADTVLVWDWERFRRGVPVGFDLLHHRLQTALVVGEEEPLGAAHRLVDAAPGTLEPLGLTARHATLTALLYLADLATRYLTDRQREAGARLGDVGSWLVPALARGVGHLEKENVR
jgi:hypothetical protein